MPFQALLQRPGINVEETPLLNSAGFSSGSGIRFFQDMPQKCGGWTVLNTQLLTGVCRGMHGWADLNSIPYIACGTNQMLEIFLGGSLFDVTPLRQTTNPAVAFSTQSGLTSVQIHDTANGSVAGDYIQVIVPVSVGGIIIYGEYLVASIVDADNYTITAASAATSTVSAGGAVPSFTATMGQPTVNVLFHNHALTSGNLWNVDVSTAVGGFTLLGEYTVTVVDADHFTIAPGGTASSTATVSENSGDTRIAYLIEAGPVNAFYPTSGAGYGAGGYGVGPYGVTSSSGNLELVRPRMWFLDNFGQDLIGNFNGSPFYVWDPSQGVGVRALALNTTNFPGAVDPPQQVNVSFVAAPQQMVIALGAPTPGTTNFDPNLVRWSDASDFTDWFAASTNLAGSYHIPSGSRIVGGAVAPNFVCIWTDVDMWLMSYLGGLGGTVGQLVWGFNKIASGVELIAPHAAGVLQGRVFWPSYEGFYVFDGQSVTPIRCPVWDEFWATVSRVQIDKVNCAVNSVFNEISWSFPTSDTGDVVARITLCLNDGNPVWTFDTGSIWAVTSWIDTNVYGSPVGATVAGALQQYETSTDASGVALPASVTTGWFAVAEGTIFSAMKWLEADLVATGGSKTVQVTVMVQDYPTGPVRTYGPYAWTAGAGPPRAVVRARGRFFSITIASTDLGVFWRLGRLRYFLQQAGKR